MKLFVALSIIVNVLCTSRLRRAGFWKKDSFIQQNVQLSQKKHLSMINSDIVATSRKTQLPIPNASTMPIYGSSSNSGVYSPRVQRIKDLSVQKEILKDVTASEFALRIEVSLPEPQDTSTESTPPSQKNPSSAAIDYGKLINKLDENLDAIRRRPELNYLGEYSFPSNKRNTEGTIVETDFNKQNENNLTARILRIKEDLELVSQNLPPKHLSEYLIDSAEANPQTGTNSRSDSPAPGNNGIKRLRILVREDGTVDWDGAIASGKEVARFGAELWERLNGKEEAEGFPSIAEIFGQAQAKTVVTEEVKSLTAIVEQSRSQVSDAVKARDTLREKLRELRREGNVEIQQEDIQTLRRLDTRIKELEKRLKLYTLNLDMQKVCEYIQQELDASSDPADQKLIIAEVALIDKQIMTMASGLINLGQQPPSQTAPLTQIDLHTGDVTEEKISDLISLIDDDELNLVYGELTDLKNRLGIDTQIAPAMDWGSLGVVASEAINKIKVGLSYFSEGTRLLLGDIQYVGVLMVKAIQGYTLKPREVNTLRRTGKDLLVLIPFTIILIIPLSPVGHVLVFSFIQRFFPEFYPSCYSEKRLNLKRLFNEIELKRDNTDVLGEEDSGIHLLPVKIEKAVTSAAKKVSVWVKQYISNE